MEDGRELERDQVSVPKPDMPDLIQREIHEHETLLSFDSDWHNAAFREWWYERGCADWQEFAQTNQGYYE